MKRRHINSGARAELLVASRLLEIGYIVSFPFFAKASYDLIADTGDRLVRVQVKTIYFGKTGSKKSWIIDFQKPKGTSCKMERYSEKDCDYIVGACPEKDSCYVFPIQSVIKKRQVTFYFDKSPQANARNNGFSDYFKELWF